MSYDRAGYPHGPGHDNDSDNPFANPAQHPIHSPSPSPYNEHTNPYIQPPPMSPPAQSDLRFTGRSPSPRDPLQQGYEMDNHAYLMHPQHQQPPLQIPMGPSADHRAGTPGDRLQFQPTYSVENVNYSMNNDYFDGPRGQHGHAGLAYQTAEETAFDPRAHHDQYYNDPYRPSPLEHDEYDHYAEGQPYQDHDDADTRPILETNDPYGPDPNQYSPAHEEELVDDFDLARKQASETPAPIKRWKTVKEVPLLNGNLVLDCPVPPRLLNQISGGEPLEREFTHMRYSAATCDPGDFYDERFTLRQRLFAKTRHTELFIVITMYNEEDELFARTLIGVIKNIEFMNKRDRSKTWGKDAWKKIVVCVVSDGRGKINPRTRAVLAGLGVYQEGIAKQHVNKKEVTAHIYEYTTQMALDLKKGVVSVKKGNTPVQMLFCLKEKNQKKINSHRWFFQAFGHVLEPNICVLIDAGTMPGKSSIYELWKVFDINPHCAGACGEIKAMLEHGKKLYNPLIAAQNFEYKMSNILDKPLESVFGFISVLPGAFSAYRFVALQNDKSGAGPLEKYFLGEKMHGTNAGVFTSNMYLAEDRILCFELVAKRNCNWVLTYVKSATGETDVPEQMPEFILQRRRWLNGSFFAAVYAIVHAFRLLKSGHSVTRKFFLMVETVYQTISMLFAWFAIGNFFLVFRILTNSLGSPDLLNTAGRVLAVLFEWLYLVTLVSCFVLALGNRPQGSNKLYMTMVIFWAVLMVYLMFAAIFITVKSIEKTCEGQTCNFGTLFSDYLFFTIVVSMLSTYVLYFVVSFLFLDPWHMFTCLIQYLLLTPTYVNILNVYAFCNTHDISWGTKGDDKPAALPSVSVNSAGKIDVAVPTDDHDLNSQYEAELLAFSKKYEVPKRAVDPDEKQKDYYRGVRSAVVLLWIFCNLALSAVVLNTGGFENIDINSNSANTTTQRSTIYMSVILWSVAGLAAFRWVGSIWFLVLRILRR